MEDIHAILKSSLNMDWTELSLTSTSSANGCLFDDFSWSYTHFCDVSRSAADCRFLKTFVNIDIFDQIGNIGTSGTLVYGLYTPPHSHLATYNSTIPYKQMKERAYMSIQLCMSKLVECSTTIVKLIIKVICEGTITRLLPLILKAICFQSPNRKKQPHKWCTNEG